MRRHRTSTLMGLTKKELVEYVRIAEYNQDVAEEALKQQAENVKDWIPVRHGRWMKKQEKDTFAGYLYSYECSECGRVELRKEPYCNCGAKMDLE